MTEDKMLEGTCECGEKGTIGEVCDICGGVFMAGNSSMDDLDDDMDAYPKDLMGEDADDDALPLEEADKETLEDETY